MRTKKNTHFRFLSLFVTVSARSHLKKKKERESKIRECGRTVSHAIRNDIEAPHSNEGLRDGVDPFD